MSDNERELFRKYVRKCSNYFEFGSGGSTYFASSISSIETITSVESDLSFLNKIKTLCPNVNIIHADIGETGNWGTPIDKTKDWSVYSKKWFYRPIEPDIVLIDGRFRVACALQVALTSTPVVIFHDFMNRQNYHVILKFYEIIESVDTLAILKLKKDISLIEIKTMLDDYLIIPD